MKKQGMHFQLSRCACMSQHISIYNITEGEKKLNTYKHTYAQMQGWKWHERVLGASPSVRGF